MKYFNARESTLEKLPRNNGRDIKAMCRIPMGIGKKVANHSERTINK